MKNIFNLLTKMESDWQLLILLVN